MSYIMHPVPSDNEENWTRDDWNTPAWVLAPIHKFANGQIGLDPCANSTSLVAAKKAFTKEDNALNKSWEGNGLVFINPPYSRELFIPFADKIVKESKNNVEIIALVPTNCETRAWQDYLWCANAICFLNKRIKFLKNGFEQGSPAGGNALVYFGQQIKRFKNIFETDAKLGKVIIQQ